MKCFKRSCKQINNVHRTNQSEGLTERINEPPWGRCLQGVVDARWVVVCCCLLFVVVVAPQGGRDSPPAEL